MTIRERIIQYLKNHPEGVDDDGLTFALGLKFRQQANSRCRQLEKEGFVKRKFLNGKIHNFWLDNYSAAKITESKKALNPQRDSLEVSKFDLWFWEGNIQSVVVNYLVSQGYSIKSVADTASKQTGVDIVAQRDGKSLWVSVKGYPKGTEKTNPSTQSAHWFTHGIFDIIKYREKNKDLELALAIPDFPRYRNLAENITWFKSAANFSYFWVDENGIVNTE